MGLDDILRHIPNKGKLNTIGAIMFTCGLGLMFSSCVIGIKYETVGFYFVASGFTSAVAGWPLFVYTSPKEWLKENK